MTVSDLINLLKKQDPNSKVVVCVDWDDDEVWYKLSDLEGSNNSHVFLNCHEEVDL